MKGMTACSGSTRLVTGTLQLFATAILKEPRSLDAKAFPHQVAKQRIAALQAIQVLY